MPSFFSPHHGRDLHLGRRDPKLRLAGRKLRLRLSDYVQGDREPVVSPPLSLDWRTYGQESPERTAALADVGLNAELGDCVIEFFAHGRPLWTGGANLPLIVMTREERLFYYEKIGGYVPSDPSTDGGCDEQDAIDYFTTTGFKDGSHLSGSVLVDASNWKEVTLANYLFGNVMTGIGGPDAWFDPIPLPGGVWDVAGAPNANNGHCTLSMGYDASATTAAPPPVARDTLLVNSWGMPLYVTREALAAYAVPSAGGELHSILSEDILNAATELAPTGIRWADLLTDLSLFHQPDRVRRASIFAEFEEAVERAAAVIGRDHTMLRRKIREHL